MRNVTLHDTRSGDRQPLEPREPGRVGIYACGPTVYGRIHVGNARPFVVFAQLKRFLEHEGYEVTLVENVTDVNDKIYDAAAAAGVPSAELAKEMTAHYLADTDRLGLGRPDHEPLASETIEEIVELIGVLIEGGHAYAADGDVYFRVRSYPRYGELSHRDVEHMDQGEGVEGAERKEDPLDFALWKAQKEGEDTAWDAPWGRGRPGWHIECSAMAESLLGLEFEIHGGGSDLVFPHHENEVAQTRAARDRDLARLWVHNGMVMVGAEKMAKSLGNFTTLKDAVDAHGPRAMRMAVLQTRYRSPVEIGDSELDDAGEAVARLDALARRARVAGVATDAPLHEEAVAEFTAAMDDDFGTPEAMAVVFRLARDTNSAIDEGDLERAAGGLVTVRELAGALGLELDDGSGADDAEIDALVEQRNRAREQRNFAEADRIRAELADRGVTLEDTPTGTIWRR